MLNRILIALGTCAGLATAFAAPSTPLKPSVVHVVHGTIGYSLERNGQPYFIQGAGGNGSPKLLAALGGNSIRTWGADKLGPLLDEAHAQGLSVAVGIWLGHERHGFNWNDAEQVARQAETVRQTVLRWKDHPAVLLWGLGNEMEGYGPGDNAAIWSAVNNLATQVKKLDPNHPTMTVVAEIGGERVKNIHRLCPDVDLVGINAYGGAATVPERYRKAGGTKPYILTEFGPPGPWEVKKTSWGAALEPTSTAKGEAYRRAYRQGVLDAKGLCLGSYAFHWGQKQEATATWFGMLLPDGSRLAAADTMAELWSGKPPVNRCPVIRALKLDGAESVDPGATLSASLEASDPEGDALKVRWIVQSAIDAPGVGGDTEDVPTTYPELIVEANDRQVKWKVPPHGGGYRLFAFVSDGRGSAATANVPFRVTGPMVVPKGRKTALPLVVYDEAR